ncbi:MAG: hypothetical protein ACLFWL_13795 [Candidatus Brocadiia bacterium]
MTTQVACRRRVLLSVLIGSLLVSMGVFAAGKSKISPSPGKDKHLVDNDLVLESVRVDVSGMEPGEYQMTVRLFDRADSKTDSVLTLRNEAQVGPTDTDGDGIPDEVESREGLDPNDPNDASEDADGDGLTNYDEYDLGTEINNPDSDDDGMPDGWEHNNGLDPLDPTGENGAEGDLDTDGHTNAFELETGTQPNDAGSGLASGTVEIEVTGTLDESVISIWPPDGQRKYAEGTVTLPWPYYVLENIWSPQFMVRVTDYEPRPDEGYWEIGGLCTLEIAGAEEAMETSFGCFLHADPTWSIIYAFPYSAPMRSFINKSRRIPVKPGSLGNIKVESVEGAPEEIAPEDIEFTPGEVFWEGLWLRCNPVLTDVDMEISGIGIDTFGKSDKQEARPYMVDPQPREPFTDMNNNNLWDTGEEFEDRDGDATYDRGEVITVKVTVVGPPNSFAGENANRVITLSWPDDAFVCTNPEGDNPHTKEGVGPATYTWELERTNSTLSDDWEKRKFAASIEDVGRDHEEYENIKPVPFGKDGKGDEIEIRPEAKANQAEKVVICKLEENKRIQGTTSPDDPYPRWWGKEDDFGNRLVWHYYEMPGDKPNQYFLTYTSKKTGNKNLIIGECVYGRDYSLVLCDIVILPDGRKRFYQYRDANHEENKGDYPDENRLDFIIFAGNFLNWKHERLPGDTSLNYDKLYDWVKEYHPGYSPPPWEDKRDGWEGKFERRLQQILHYWEYKRDVPWHEEN